MNERGSSEVEEFILLIAEGRVCPCVLKSDFSATFPQDWLTPRPKIGLNN